MILQSSENIFGTICNGCPDTCNGCSFAEVRVIPTCTSLSEAGVEHATSEGGTTTLEELYIHKGYWRAKNTSKNVFECFNTEACEGGVSGTPNYCLKGYEGPCKHSSRRSTPPPSRVCRVLRSPHHMEDNSSSSSI